MTSLKATSDHKNNVNIQNPGDKLRVRCTFHNRFLIVDVDEKCIMFTMEKCNFPTIAWGMFGNLQIDLQAAFCIP